MSPRPLRDTAASVKQRLLNLAKKQGEDFNFLLSRFAAERFLFRLSQSAPGRGFVLKGAMLFHLRAMQMPHRATHDLDLLGTGTPDPARMERLFRGVCQVQVPDDGLTFPEQNVRAEHIKPEDEYLGVRVRLQARMGSARIPLQIDVGFGDAVIPAPKQELLATLLDFPAPAFLVYPWEAVIAEKFNAIVHLGMDNSRMKDYFDLHHLAATRSFTGRTMAQAIRASFERRRSQLPSRVPTGLRSEFAMDAAKQIQWRAFLRKLRMAEDALSLETIIAGLQGFLMPPVEALVQGVPFDKQWDPGGPWRE